MNALRWGLLSTAAIGTTVVGATRASKATQFVAVASRDQSRARQYADDNGLADSFGSYDALLEFDGIDAVYVAGDIRRSRELGGGALNDLGCYCVYPGDRFGISHEDDVYRIEFDAVSDAILSGALPAYGRNDAVAQARALEVRQSAEQSEPVEIS